MSPSPHPINLNPKSTDMWSVSLHLFLQSVTMACCFHEDDPYFFLLAEVLVDCKAELLHPPIICLGFMAAGREVVCGSGQAL